MSVGGLHLIAAAHAADRGVEHGAAGVAVLLTGGEEGLLADDAVAAHLFDVAAAVGDDPVAAQQAGGNGAGVGEGDVVGEGVASSLGAGLVGQVFGGDRDFDRVGEGLGHADP